jgi:hypothetical protein
MKKLLFISALAIASLQLFAQKNTPKNEVKLPLNAASWDSKNGNLKFADHNGVPSIEITTGNELVTAKNFNFANGTLEYDVEFMGGFTGVYFRRESDEESEFFYLRNRPGEPTKIDGAQYTPIIKKVNMWDMLPEYQAAANFNKGVWTHIKLVVSGNQMLVYVNDKMCPTLQIPRLEGNTKQGTIAFTGQCFISNVVVKHNEVEGLSAAEGYDPTYHDNRYIRNWQVSQPMPLPLGQELNGMNLPDVQTAWQNISAERRGLINVTRLYGNSDSRRFVWLRTKIIAKKEQKMKVDLGFSDEVWVFLNDKTAFVDKNLYAQDMRKDPDGRISVNNSKFELNLKEGENDLLIGLANDFYGWGIIPRLDNLDGITLDTNYKQSVVNKEWEPYFGTYASTKFPIRLKVSQKNDKLILHPAGQGPLVMENSGRDAFKFEQFGIVIEFTPADKKMVMKQGGDATDFFKE